MSNHPRRRPGAGVRRASGDCAWWATCLEAASMGWTAIPPARRVSRLRWSTRPALPGTPGFPMRALLRAIPTAARPDSEFARRDGASWPRELLDADRAGERNHARWVPGRPGGGGPCACRVRELSEWNAAAGQAWNRLRLGLSRLCPFEYIRVVEVQRRGALHPHILVWSASPPAGPSSWTTPACSPSPPPPAFPAPPDHQVSSRAQSAARPSRMTHPRSR